LIRVQSLSKRLNEKVVLDDVSFEVSAGITALLGPNGAGKTTLLRILSGIWHPTSGSVAIGGHDLASQPVEAKRQLGFQPEFPDLAPAMTPRELFDFTAAARRISAADVAAAVERFGIGELLAKRCGTLSQGQKRLVTLVAATMHRPPVLLLDEPTNALDPHRVAALKTYLRGPDAPRAALLSTHQLDFVSTLADRFVILSAGRIVTVGDLGQVRLALGMPKASLEEIVLRSTTPA
jgi:ABC-2 type transport system ATP-binding protein